MKPTAFIVLLLIALAPAFVPEANGAPKTDVVILRNGDHLTCEIKKLEHGKLQCKTDDLGTVQIEWDKIARVTSVYFFLVRTDSGTQHYGSLADSGRDSLVVVTLRDRVTPLSMARIVGIEAIKYDFWDKFDLATSLGLSYAKGTDVAQLYLNLSAKYRGRIHSGGLDYKTNYTDKGEDQPIFRRTDLQANYSRRLSGRLGGVLTTGFERNDEMDLDARVLGGANVSYALHESNSSDLSTLAGLNLTREWPAGITTPTNNLEARLSAGWSVFAYDTPKTDINVGVDVYPNLTTGGRLRSQIDITARREVAKDLFIELSYYDTRDNKPPSGADSSSDRGIVFSVGWSK